MKGGAADRTANKIGREKALGGKELRGENRETMRSYRYIVVEDEDLLRKSLIKKIENLALPFRFAGEADNGQDALQLVGEVCPDLLLTDIMMPVMDGMELAERLYEEYPEVKIIIITGYNDFTFAQKAIRFGVTDYLLKPVEVQELCQTLRRVEERFRMSEKSSAAFRKEYLQKQLWTVGKGNGTSKEEIAELLEQYLKENFREEISLGDLAAMAGFTPDYLSRVYKKYRKESPLRYLTRLRIEEAKKILAEQPLLGIGEAGALAGYPDPYYFSRVFKEQTGCYPSEYRKTALEKGTRGQKENE